MPSPCGHPAWFTNRSTATGLVRTIEPVLFEFAGMRLSKTMFRRRNFSSPALSLEPQEHHPIPRDRSAPSSSREPCGTPHPVAPPGRGVRSGNTWRLPQRFARPPPFTSPDEILAPERAHALPGHCVSFPPPPNLRCLPPWNLPDRLAPRLPWQEPSIPWTSRQLRPSQRR